MKTALVVGGAACVFDDVIAANKLFNPERVYAVNDAGVYLKRLNVWCTLHPEFLDGWEQQRKGKGFDRNYDTVAPLKNEVGMHGEKGRINRRISYRWPGMTSSASSGIYAAKVALEDGFKVVLAGIPMTAEDGHFLPDTLNGQGTVRGKVWTQHNQFVSGFTNAVNFMFGRVKSMSGYTQKVLGAPSTEWLNSLVGGN